MITDSNFKKALFFLDHLTNQSNVQVEINFDEKYQKQNPILTALKILHEISNFGTKEQKKTLGLQSKRIVEMNKLLKLSEIFSKRIERKFTNIIPKIDEWEKMQVALPSSNLWRLVRTILKIPGFAVAVFGDLLLRPIAGFLLLFEILKIDFNPKGKNIKKNKTPFLFLHGSGYCQIQWIVMRQFLKGTQFGSVFTCNYGESLVQNDPKSGIETYANKIRSFIKEIAQQTGQKRIIIGAHSMGGPIGEYYAQHFAEQDGIEVVHLLSISSPWRGSSTIDLLKLKALRYQQMSKKSGEEIHINFRKTLIENAKKAERTGKRCQWSIWSEHDPAVPGKSGCLSEDPRRQYGTSFLGHGGPMFSFRILWKVRSWCKEMMKREELINSK